MNNGIKDENKSLEEYIEVELFRDNDRYRDDVFVSVGGDNCVIKRGAPVRIKRKFALVLEQSHRQDMKTQELIEREAQ